MMALEKIPLNGEKKKNHMKLRDGKTFTEKKKEFKTSI